MNMIIRLLLPLVLALPAGAVSLVSVNARGEAGNGFSRAPAISADGRYIAFMSAASNLVEGDANGKADIFLRDRKEGTVTRISMGMDGEEADGDSSSPAISADGRVIAFLSQARNLVPEDTNKAADVFTYDRETGEMARASVNSRRTQAAGASGPPAISADGRFVAFRSEAENLVLNDSNGFADIFRHDRREGVTIRVNVSSKGEEADGPSSGVPALSADGRYVAFVSNAANLIPDDANGVTQDVFVRDVAAGTTTCISRPPGRATVTGESAGPSISADGRYVAFISFAESLVPGDANHAADVFLHDRQQDTLTRITAGNDASLAVSLSADGRALAYLSHASDLAAGDANGYPDIFRYDVATKTAVRVNVSAAGAEADDDSSAPAISGDCTVIAFVCWSSMLMPENKFSCGDVFVSELPDRGPAARPE